MDKHDYRVFIYLVFWMIEKRKYHDNICWLFWLDFTFLH